MRSEEWLTSVPLHLQLFQAFGLTPPKYCHVAPISKMDNGKKRKISKRHDPEADVRILFER
jgi:glutamyl-tRNA synthetase